MIKRNGVIGVRGPHRCGAEPMWWVWELVRTGDVGLVGVINMLHL
jgi:hypothetical protein